MYAGLRSRLLWIALAWLAVGCGSAEPAREAAILSAILSDDEPLLRSRPELVHGKYARMARDLYSFYRGTVPLFVADLRDSSFDISRTRFDAPGPFPLSTGDQHPENFGILKAADGSLAFEPNDFDAADRYPYWHDLRRLSVGMVLMAFLASPNDAAANQRARDAAHDIARAVAESYAEAIQAHAAGAPRERVTDDQGVLGLSDLFRRAERDDRERRELSEQTRIVDGRRTLRRGVISLDDPEEALLDLPDFAHDFVPDVLEQARQTLLDPPEPEFFTVLDAARLVGKGVASWPRVRIIALVRGPTDAPDDDELIEIKEIIDSAAEGYLPPERFANDLAHRVIETSRMAWARPDAEPLFGAAHALGMSWIVRRESEAHKTLRVHRQEGSRGTPDALSGLARALAAVLARIHASPAPGAEGAAASIARTIARDPSAFVAEEADIAVAYAAQVETDWQRFRGLFARLGPRLGMPTDLRDRPRVDLRALFGVGEPVRAVE